MLWKRSYGGPGAVRQWLMEDLIKGLLEGRLRFAGLAEPFC
jgi:hypothetical protein